MSHFQIEKDVPLPQRLKKMPFERMSRGESFTVTLTKPSDANTIRQRVYRFCKKHPNKKFAVIMETEDTARVFCTED